jgi:TrmH family RNA methyltransferase
MKHITSRDNPFIKNLVKLSQSARERRKQGLTLIDGVHLVDVYRRRCGAPQAIVVSESGLDHAEIAALLKKFDGVAVTAVGDGLFKEISPLVSPAGLLAVVATPGPGKVPADLAFCLLCEGIQDPGNLGSILRSAAAAGVAHVFLSKDCVFAWSPRVIRAGQGAHFLLAIHESANLADVAGNFHGKVVATSLDAPTHLFDIDLTGPVAVLIGNEGSGLSEELLALASHRVKIPMPGETESLNVAAAAAVCLFERVRQTRKPV